MDQYNARITSDAAPIHLSICKLQYIYLADTFVQSNFQYVHSTMKILLENARIMKVSKHLSSWLQLHFPLTREQDPEIQKILHLGQ